MLCIPWQVCVLESARIDVGLLARRSSKALSLPLSGARRSSGGGEEQEVDGAVGPSICLSSDGELSFSSRPAEGEAMAGQGEGDPPFQTTSPVQWVYHDDSGELAPDLRARASCAFSLGALIAWLSGRERTREPCS